MKVTVTDLANVPAKDHTLLHSPHYAAQLAGSSLFFQVMSGLLENPVRVILHDKFSGKRQLLTIETSEKLVKPNDSHVALKAQLMVEKAAIKTVKSPADNFDSIKMVMVATPTLPPEAKKSPLPVSPSATPVARAPTPSLSPSLTPKVAPAPKLIPSGGMRVGEMTAFVAGERERTSPPLIPASALCAHEWSFDGENSEGTEANFSCVLCGLTKAATPGTKKIPSVFIKSPSPYIKPKETK